MPKIRINEYDMTGVIQKSPISNIIYIPILTDEAIPLITEKGKVVSICYSRNELKNRIESHLVKKTELPSTEGATVKAAEGTTVKAEDVKESIELAKKSRVMYNIATRLIDLGFPVLVEGVAATEKTITVTVDKKTETTKVKEVAIPTDSINLLKDKSLFDIRFLTSGIDVVNNESLIEVADERQDCIALINLDETATDFDYTVATVRAGFVTNSSVYAAGFTPWFYSKHPTLIKGVEDSTTVSDKPATEEAEEVAIPAAYGYLFAYGRMLANNAAEWQAVAGPERGIIPELSDVFYTYSYEDVEILQARAADKLVELDDATDNVGIAINPIAWVRPNGYILYGNRTLKNNDTKKKTTAQSFLNIRNGVNAIKKVMYDAGRIFVFEQNTEVLWTNFRNYITPLLDRMQSSDGLLGYTFVKVATDAKARLKAKLTVIPVEAVEDFDLDVYLVDDLTVTER